MRAGTPQLPTIHVQERIGVTDVQGIFGDGCEKFKAQVEVTDPV